MMSERIVSEFEKISRCLLHKERPVVAKGIFVLAPEDQPDYQMEKGFVYGSCSECFSAVLSDEQTQIRKVETEIKNKLKERLN